MKRIAVLTSGGDAPGMNACLRAVVRTAHTMDISVLGVQNGYRGLLEGQYRELGVADVAHIVHRGGTILKTARCQAFLEAENRRKAVDLISREGADGLITIGGDGTFAGAHKLWEETGFPVIGLPGTIDNDLFGTDFTIGYDTAINTVVDAVDKIRDTAYSHDRLFVVEVMGRDAGFIALRSGIASGAEAILVPETVTRIEALITRLRDHRRQDKTGGILVVAEGDDFGGGKEVKDAIEKHLPEYEVRLTILGHIQRGGNPSAMDRVLASHLGHAAVIRLAEGLTDHMVGWGNSNIVCTPLEQAVKHHQKVDRSLLDLSEILSV